MLNIIELQGRSEWTLTPPSSSLIVVLSDQVLSWHHWKWYPPFWVLLLPFCSFRPISGVRLKWQNQIQRGLSTLHFNHLLTVRDSGNSLGPSIWLVQSNWTPFSGQKIGYQLCCSVSWYHYCSAVQQNITPPL